MKKNNRSSNQNHIILDYIFLFSNFSGKFSSFQSNELNHHINLYNLALSLKYEFYENKNIIIKYGDSGDKFYLLLKGSVDIVVPKWHSVLLSEEEYMYYLCKLKYYNENELLHKTLDKNNRFVYSTKFYLNQYISDKFSEYGKSERSRNGETFVVNNYNDKNLSNFNLQKNFINNNSSSYIFSKKNYKIYEKLNNDSEKLFKKNYKDILNSPKIFETIDLSEKTENYLNKINAEEIKNMKKSELSTLNLENKNNFFSENSNRDEIKNYFNDEINSNENSNKFKIFFKKKLSKEENKSSNETTNHNISFNDAQDYISRILPVLREKSYLEEEKKEKHFILLYHHIKTLESGETFGELALQKNKGKRTATIIAKEDCHICFLDKKVYNKTLLDINNKDLNRNLHFFLNGPIFLNYNKIYFFRNIYNLLSCQHINKGELLVKENDNFEDIYFIKEGTFEVKKRCSLLEINNLITRLGGKPKNLSKEQDIMQGIYFYLIYLPLK